MVFDGGFAAASDDDDVLDTGVQCFFHAVLDDGLVNQRQHLFWLSFRGGEKTGAQPGGWKHGLAHLCGHHLQCASGGD